MIKRYLKPQKKLDDVLRESLKLYIERRDVEGFIEVITEAYLEGHRNSCLDMA